LPAALAVFYLVRDLLFPLPMTELVEGLFVLPRTSHLYRTAEVITLVGALSALLIFRQRMVSMIAAGFTVVFGVSTAASAALHLNELRPSDDRASLSKVQSSPTESSAADKPDIYQILFDEYQTVENRFARRQTGIAPFDDFTCYTDNVCNYNWTRLSLPSLWSGTLYQPEEDIQEWQVAARHDGGLFKVLKQHGYHLRIYGFYPFWCESPHIDFLRCNRDVVRDWQARRPAGAFTAHCDELLQLLHLRCLPSIFAKFLMSQQRHDLPPAGAHSFYSAALFREMVAAIKDRPAGGTYNFLHLLIPHPPFVLNGKGEYVGPQEGSRYGQVLTVDLLVSELVAELKRLGRYERSLIIVHADTGAWTDPDLASQEVVNGKALREVRERRETLENGTFYDGPKWPERLVAARSRAALLIKAPGQKGHREVNAPTQLLDLYPTILAAANIAEPRDPRRPGVNLLAELPASDRVRRTYVFCTSSPRPKMNIPLQEWVIEGPRFERGRLLTMRGQLDFDWAGE